MNIEPLIPVFGEAFLSYVLALEDGQGLANRSLTEQQITVANFLEAQSRQSPNISSNDEFSHYSSLARLGSYAQDFDTSLANGLRQQAGGKLPVVQDTEDNVLKHLRVLARDAWPSYMLP